MIGYSRLHCWGDSERLVNPGKVVMHEVEGHGMGLVLDLFTEGIGQPSHSAHAHPHREILPFNKAG